MIYCPSCNKPHNASRLYGSFCSSACQKIPPPQRANSKNSRLTKLFLRQEGYVTCDELAKFFECDRQIAYKILDQLVQKGQVERVFGLTQAGVDSIT